VEAAEQDAAIRTGKRDGLPALRLYRFRIATLKTEDDGRQNHLVAGPTTALRRNLLGPRRRVASRASAGCAAAATRPLNVRVGSLATRTGCSGWLRGPRCPLTAAATPRVLVGGAMRVRRLLRLGRAAARGAGQPLQGHQRSQQPNKGFRRSSGPIHKQPAAQLWQRPLPTAATRPIVSSQSRLDTK
jgi:hypothetical protein